MVGKITQKDNAHRILRFYCLIHKEFLPESTTLNAVAYAEFLECLLQRIHRVRPEYAKSPGLFSRHTPP
ncbi:hypothetical protein TNCV_4213061 [Trichonephila clavipes]|nr:hypothetical protein TNCV_4213061 [Trichonephila clavipes]